MNRRGASSLVCLLSLFLFLSFPLSLFPTITYILRLIEEDEKDREGQSEDQKGSRGGSRGIRSA